MNTHVRSSTYRGYLLFWVNTKYISSSAEKKKQYFSRVCSTSENADIFTERDEIYLVFTKKSIFSFYFILNGKYRKHNLTFSLVVSRSI